MLFIYLFTFTSILSHIQGGTEETHVFQMASTWQGWGWWRGAWAGGQLRQCSFSSHGALEHFLETDDSDGLKPSEHSVLIWNCILTLNIEHSTEKTLDSNYGITVSKNCSMANTWCSMFQCAMATETALSELSAVSHPTSSTPPLQSTSHLKRCVFSALTCSNIGLVQNYTSKIKTNYL